VHIPATQRAALEQSLAGLKNLSIIVRADEAAGNSTANQSATLDVFGHDRPGIVREFTTALAAQGVNVEELSTACTSAPMSGEPWFTATAKLAVPAGVPLASLRQILENKLDGLTVEISVRV
jgi:glycine cleavage system regulatory protein